MIKVPCPCCAALNDVWYDDFIEPIDVKCGNCCCWFEVRKKVEYEAYKSKDSRPAHIFSGGYSAKMWRAVNTARSADELQGRALYLVCCRMQRLERRVNELRAKLNLGEQSDST